MSPRALALASLAALGATAVQAATYPIVEKHSGATFFKCVGSTFSMDQERRRADDSLLSFTATPLLLRPFCPCSSGFTFYDNYDNTTSGVSSLQIGLRRLCDSGGRLATLVSSLLTLYVLLLRLQDVVFVNSSATPALAYVNDAGHAIVKVSSLFSPHQVWVRVLTTFLFGAGFD